MSCTSMRQWSTSWDVTAGPPPPGAACSATVGAVKDPPMDLRPPLKTMTARPTPQLPEEQHSDSLTFEPKLGGWRCLAFDRLDGRVALQSRHQKLLTPYFPEIVGTIVEQLPPGTVLDGELVVYREGRCDFAALQQRLSGRPSPATAASFVVFDALTVAGQDLRGLPYRKRRKQLRRLLAD